MNPPPYGINNEGSGPARTQTEQQYNNQYNNVQAYPKPPAAGVGQNILFAYQSPTTRIYDNYAHYTSKALGIVQIIVGALCIIFNIVGVSLPAPVGFSVVGFGIWGGILFVLTGSFGIAACKNRTKCWIITFMVFCILSACTCIVVFSLGVLGAVVSDVSYYGDYYYDHHYRDYAKVEIAMLSFLAISAIVEAIAAIWGSVICCKAVGCCSTTPYNNGPVMVPIQTTQVQGYPMQNNGQVMFIQQPQHFGAQAIPYSAPSSNAMQTPVPNQQFNQPAPNQQFNQPAPNQQFNHSAYNQQSNQPQFSGYNQPGDDMQKGAV
jgi:hypothetical protein